MYFIVILILCVLFFFEFKFREKYLFRMSLTFITSILFMVLLGFNAFSPDLDSYRIHYEDIDLEYIRLSVEPFVYYLMTVCKNVGLSFEGYQLLFSLITFSFFTYSIFKYSPFPVFVFLNFFFIPFFPDITQARFFLGFTFFLFSLQFFNTRKKLFYLLLLIAILCHFSLLIVLVFLVIRRFNFFKSQFKSNSIIISGIALLLLIPKNILEPLLILLNPKYSTYFDPNAEGLGTFMGTLALFIPFFILNNIILWQYHNVFPKDKIPAKYAKNMPLFIELVQFFNYIILFQYFIRDFSRFTQNGLIIASIYVSMVLYALIEENKKPVAVVLAIIFVCYTIIIYYVQFLMVNKFQYFEVINQTFTSNYLFDYIVNLFDFRDR